MTLTSCTEKSSCARLEDCVVSLDFGWPNTGSNESHVVQFPNGTFYVHFII